MSVTKSLRLTTVEARLSLGEEALEDLVDADVVGFGFEGFGLCLPITGSTTRGRNGVVQPA